MNYFFNRGSLPDLAILALCAGFAVPASAQSTTTTRTYTWDGNPVAIPHDSTDRAAVAEILVPSQTVISNVSVRVVVSYPAVGDLEVYLLSAEGDRIDLLNNDCGGLANIDTTFDDSGTTAYEDFCPAEAGRGPFRPTEALSALRGQTSAGYWDLVVENNRSNSNEGSIRSFAVTISGTAVTTPSFNTYSVTNTAREDGGVIAPGELASIYGASLGPETAVTAPSLPLPTSLGGTTVTINGTPAPILYASSLRVDFQVPFTVQPGTVAELRVQNGTQNSAALPIEVVSAFAGVYTQQTNGRGQAVAANQDGTVNSSSNAAPQGSYVSLYATGLGQVTPNGTAGQAAPVDPLARVGNIVVLVGGAAAEVTYAGLAPGLVGTYQINFRLPSNLVPGARNVVVLPPNGYPSQGRTYIWVR
jgi:uncharacterized protein (TIGR03437 family)